MSDRTSFSASALRRTAWVPMVDRARPGPAWVLAEIIVSAAFSESISRATPPPVWRSKFAFRCGSIVHRLNDSQAFPIRDVGAAAERFGASGEPRGPAGVGGGAWRADGACGSPARA